MGPAERAIANLFTVHEIDNAADVLLGPDRPEVALATGVEERILFGIERGLLTGPPSQITRRALTVYPPVRLFLLLGALAPESPASIARNLRRGVQRAEAGCRALLRLQGAVGAVAAVRADLLAHDRSMADVRQALPRAVDEEVRVATERAAQARWLLRAFEVSRRDHAMSRRRREALGELASDLRAAEPGKWGPELLTDLILASGRDWTVSPCEALLAKYAGPDDEPKLVKLLKSDLEKLARGERPQLDS